MIAESVSECCSPTFLPEVSHFENLNHSLLCPSFLNIYFYPQYIATVFFSSLSYSVLAYICSYFFSYVPGNRAAD